jgi:hypothetical protein
VGKDSRIPNAMNRKGLPETINNAKMRISQMGKVCREQQTRSYRPAVYYVTFSNIRPFSI